MANTDCTKLVGIEIKKSDWHPLTDWSKFRAFYFTQPECRLINIDLCTGEPRVILQEKRWLGHPIYRPFDDNTVAFCHEGPRDAIDARMWLINEDGSNLRKVRQHAPVAPRAAELGLVNRLTPEGGALDGALELAARIAANGPLAVAVTKQVARSAPDWTGEESWEKQQELMMPVFVSEDAQEGDNDNEFYQGKTFVILLHNLLPFI